MTSKDSEIPVIAIKLEIPGREPFFLSMAIEPELAARMKRLEPADWPQKLFAAMRRAAESLVADLEGQVEDR